jgi:undecaprenyl-diphosphatase
MLEWLLHLDRLVFTRINSVWTHPWLDAFFPFITDLHKTIFFKFILVPLVLILFVWRRGLKKGLIIFLFSLLSIGFSDFAGTQLFKNRVQRPRPAFDTQLHAITRSPFGGYSFVSNHASNNFAFATFVSSFFPAARAFLFFIAVLVCYSRVYNGVHYPTDVIGGAVFGILVGFLMVFLCRKTLQWLDRKREVSS